MNHFFLLKRFFSNVIFLVTLFKISEHSGSIGKFIEKGEKSILFLSAKGAGWGVVRALKNKIYVFVRVWVV